MAKRKKKSETSKLTDQLDAKWRVIVKLKAGMRCEKCGALNGLNAHHVVGRANMQTRWLLENGCCLCAGCHKFSRTCSAHGTPTIFAHWIINNRGEEWHDELTSIANSYKKWTVEVKKELLNEFKEMLKNYVL